MGLVEDYLMNKHQQTDDIVYGRPLPRIFLNTYDGPYEGLFEGFRAAVGITMTTWIDTSTDELVVTLERREKNIWTMRIARSEIGREPRVVQEVERKAYITATEIVDRILDEVDWNTFF